MKYLKITAENYTEAMKKLRKEYGDEAIPISHKYIKEGGLFKTKLFGKEVVELTAAVKDIKTGIASKLKKTAVDFTVDEDVLAKSEKPTLGKVQDIIERASAKRNDMSLDGINQTIRDVSSRLDDARKGSNDFSLKSEKNGTAQISPQQDLYKTDNENSDIVSGIEKEVSEIKAALNRLIERENSSDSAMFGETQKAGDKTVFSPYREILRDNDFEPEDCDMIIKEVKRTVSFEDLKDKYSIEKGLKDLLKSRIVTTGPFKKTGRKKIVMFVGPTGVGKTTTMAKLGAIHSLREGESVSFITIDTYRIAATEQLKKYAEIMRIPIHVVNDQKGFKETVAREKSDLIFVDTSGRSHRNELKISEIKSFADSIDYDLEKVLCVSANTKKGDLKKIFGAFDVMQFDSVIITKVDESSFVGNVVNVADIYNKPISYYTDGQEVPNNIHVADPDGIVNMMIRDSSE